MKLLIAVSVLLVVAGGAAAQRPPDPRGEVFARQGCTSCHAIAGLGLTASADVAPDLTFAYGDVVRRYGVNLESFMANPTGVMRLMLGAHIGLSVAARDSIVDILKALYVERRAEQRDEPRPDSFPTHRVSRP